MQSYMFICYVICNIVAELQGREERSKQYFDKVLNGVGGSEVDELLNEVCTFILQFLFSACSKASVVQYFCCRG